MMGLGTQELILIMVAALLIFGPKKLPEIGKSVGSALRELRRASNEFVAGIEHDEPDPPRASKTRLDDRRAGTASAETEDEYQKAGES